MVGIDLGQATVWGVAAERGAGGWHVVDGRAFPAADAAEVVRWCDGATVAIDAPGARSEGRHLADASLSPKFQRARCAEVALLRAGHAVSWVAPLDGAPVAAWMQVGFDLWDAFGDRSPLEVFPYAVFAELLGARPPKKQTPAGQRARLDVVARHLRLPTGVELWGHDGIDAAAAAIVAGHHADGRARRLGCDHDDGSVMWLPAVGG